MTDRSLQSMPDSLPSWLATQLQALQTQQRYRRRAVITPLDQGRCRRDERTLVNFGSNDYLDLRSHPDVVRALTETAAQVGVGAGASMLVCGRSPLHEQLERALASFEQCEAVTLFPSGYAANLGTIASLTRSGDVVHCDRANHASLVDGCRLSEASLRVFRHDQLDRLRRRLKQSRDARRFIVTDSVFSMDGDLAPLPELLELARQYDATLLVDEAHGTGVYGKQGCGVCEHLEVDDPRIIKVGTLSKALGTQGGFVCGSQQLGEWIWNSARPQFYSTGLPPAICAAAVAALEILQRESHRRERLWALSSRLRDQLRAAGWDVRGEQSCPIIPVILGSESAALAVAAHLDGRGFLVPAIRPPTVAPGTARLRISLSSAHTDFDVEQLVACLEECRHLLPEAGPSSSSFSDTVD